MTSPRRVLPRGCGVKPQITVLFDASHCDILRAGWVGWPAFGGVMFKATMRGGFAVALGAFGLAWICLSLPHGPEHISPLWLPNAFVLAALLLARRSAWLGLAIAGLTGDFLANLAVGDGLGLAAGLALCNAIEFTACAALVARFMGRTPDMASAASVVKFAAIALAACTMSAALAGVMLGVFTDHAGLAAYVTWVMGDFAGLMLVTPCLLVIYTHRQQLHHLLSVKAWPLAVLVATTVWVFNQERPLALLVLASLLLVTWRLGVLGAAIGVFLMTAVATTFTYLGRGPFTVGGSLAVRVMAVQAFLLGCAYINLALAIRRWRAAGPASDLFEA